MAYEFSETVWCLLYKFLKNLFSFKNVCFYLQIWSKSTRESIKSCCFTPKVTCWMPVYRILFINCSVGEFNGPNYAARSPENQQRQRGGWRKLTLKGVCWCTFLSFSTRPLTNGNYLLLSDRFLNEAMSENAQKTVMLCMLWFFIKVVFPALIELRHPAVDFKLAFTNSSDSPMLRLISILANTFQLLIHSIWILCIYVASHIFLYGSILEVQPVFLQ